MVKECDIMLLKSSSLYFGVIEINRSLFYQPFDIEVVLPCI
jgi:hypothetical protein